MALDVLNLRPQSLLQGVASARSATSQALLIASMVVVSLAGCSSDAKLDLDDLDLDSRPKYKYNPPTNLRCHHQPLPRRQGGWRVPLH